MAEARSGDGPAPAWPPWTAPVALVGGLALAVIGSVLAQGIAAGAGVTVTTGHIPPGLNLADTAIQDACFITIVLLLAWWGGRRLSPSQFGLVPVRIRVAALAVVLVLGASFLFLAAWASLIHLGGADRKILRDLGADRNEGLLIATTVLVTVLAPLAEELLFRGYIFSALRNWRGPWPAATITGLAFGAVHAASQPVGYLLPLGFLGFCLCMAYWRTGSLYPCIAAHSLNNSWALGEGEHWTWQIPLLAIGALAGLAMIAALVAQRSAWRRRLLAQ